LVRLSLFWKFPLISRIRAFNNMTALGVDGRMAFWTSDGWRACPSTTDGSGTCLVLCFLLYATVLYFYNCLVPKKLVYATYDAIGMLSAINTDGGLMQWTPPTTNPNSGATTVGTWTNVDTSTWYVSKYFLSHAHKKERKKN
jgi:hypothetical protein